MPPPVSDDLPTARIAAVASQSGGAVAGAAAGAGDVIAQRYVLLDTVGEGGMGVVWAAYDRELDRKVALKVLHDQFLGAAHQGRLRREAQAMARLSHPNVVPVYDVGEHGGRTFLTMEFVRGAALPQWLETARDWRAIQRVFVDAGRGLAAAHASGIVHRDFKPSNLLLGEDGRVRVADFGVARAGVGTDGGGGVSAARPGPVTIETETGALIGSPAYMAPEQLRGETADARSDQFGLCVALYEALCGKRPFEGATVFELAAAIHRGPPPLTAAAPSWLTDAIRRGLSEDPAGRFPTTDALVTALEGPPQRRSRTVVWAVALAVVVVAGATLAVTRPWSRGAAPPRPRCDDAGAAIDELWPARRSAVADAFAGATAPVDDVGRTLAKLDEHADRWRAEAVAVCRAARIEESLSPDLHDRAVVCLAEHRASFAALVAGFAAGGASLGKALDGVGRLGNVARCGNPTFLVGESPLPEDPAIAAQVLAALEELEAAKIEITIGDFAGVAAIAERLRRTVPALAHPPLSRELTRLEATMARDRRDFELARSLFETVYFDARAQRASNASIRTCAPLIAITSEKLGRRDEGALWSRLCLADVSGVPEDEVASDVYRMAAAQARLVGDNVRGRELAAHSVEILERLGATQGLPYAAALQSLGTSLVRQGNNGEAAVIYRRAIAVIEAYYGPTARALEGLLSNLSYTLANAGEYDAAVEAAQRAVEVGRGNPSSVDGALLDLGQVLVRAGRHAEAKTAVEQAMAKLVAVHGPDHPDVALCWNTLGEVADHTGDSAAGLDAYRHAIAILEKTVGPEAPDLAAPVIGVGNMLHQLDKDREALPYFERGIAILTRAPSENRVGYALMGKAISLIALGKPGAALEDLDRALALRDVAGAELLPLATTLRYRGLALVRLDRTAEGIADLRRALEIFERAGAPGDAARALVTSQLEQLQK